jgi:hypothetical protein
MARSSLLALAVILAACSAAIVPPPAPVSSRPPRTYPAAPVDPASFAYPATAASFIAALNEGREADAYALLGEHFLGTDCDYQSRSIWYMSGRESARYWLQRRITEHDRIDVLDRLDGGTYESALRFLVRRSSDAIGRAGIDDGSVVPRAKLVIRFTVDGSQLSQWGWAWEGQAPRATPFADCMP